MLYSSRNMVHRNIYITYYKTPQLIFNQFSSYQHINYIKYIKYINYLLFSNKIYQVQIRYTQIFMAEDHNFDILSRTLTKMGIFHQRLTEKFTSMGLDIEDEHMQEVEPVLKAQEKLEQLIGQFVNRVDQVFEEQTILRDVLKQNDQFMSTFYECMLGLTQSFIRYSKQVYSTPQSLESLRTFRMLYESFSNCSTLLNGYAALTEEFAETQKKYVQQQVSLFTKIIFKDQKDNLVVDSIQDLDTQQLKALKQQNTQLKQLLRRYEQELNKYTSRNNDPEEVLSANKDSKRQLELIKRVQELEALVIQNNDQFAIEVQRYNRLLYEEREEFNRLELQADEEVRRLQFNFRQLQKQLENYKEERFKDQLMIENMARKLRGYERERRGYPSPRINLSSEKSSALHIGLPKRQNSGFLFKRNIDF